MRIEAILYNLPGQQHGLQYEVGEHDDSRVDWLGGEYGDTEHNLRETDTEVWSTLEREPHTFTILMQMEKINLMLLFYKRMDQNNGKLWLQIDTPHHTNHQSHLEVHDEQYGFVETAGDVCSQDD